ncbi:MAG: protein translocase subunit SecD [Candidatus Levybacteria bacterium]|nr:protein translocase subunit SecD [Candidatus Levybacteria bacterium]
MKNPRFLFWLIVVLTVIAVVIDLPKSPLSSGILLGQFRLQKDISFKKGLDLEGGVSIAYQADMGKIGSLQRTNALEAAAAIIERRVNLFGVSEPIVQTAAVNGDWRIIVELPGVSDVNQAVRLIGTTAQLEFREVLLATLSAIPTAETTKSTGLTGADLTAASVSFDSNTGEPVVLFEVASSSQEKFFKATQKLVEKQMAIFLDNRFISAPTVREAIRDSGQISGGFTTEQARALSIQLNAGALPVPLSILEQRTIGATLGEISLQKSLFAAFLGFLVIVLFMSILYGRLGILASLALILYTFFVLALFKLIPVTLTLAGIGGFVLSIGMAVDANILIFERMREEIRRGRARDVATELGFSRAWSSIRDSNVSSLITSAILYYFGTGPVRGFALTLAIGVLVSMFSAIVVTRTFLRLVYREARA